MLEQIIDRQKLSRMMDRSERIYLKEKEKGKCVIVGRSVRKFRFNKCMHELNTCRYI